jgi:hypothetical protein
MAAGVRAVPKRQGGRCQAGMSPTNSSMLIAMPRYVIQQDIDIFGAVRSRCQTALCVWGTVWVCRGAALVKLLRTGQEEQKDLL